MYSKIKNQLKVQVDLKLERKDIFGENDFSMKIVLMSISVGIRGNYLPSSRLYI